MLRNKALLGTVFGAAIAVIWLTFNAAAVLLVLALAALGWLLGTVIDRPDVLIAWLERLRDR